MGVRIGNVTIGAFRMGGFYEAIFTLRGCDKELLLSFAFCAKRTKGHKTFIMIFHKIL